MRQSPLTLREAASEVQYTGPGLDPEKSDRLFQSFYTTKPDGIGMGLAINSSMAEAPWRVSVGGSECPSRRRLSIDPAGRRDALGEPGTIAPLTGAAWRGHAALGDFPNVCPAYTEI
jgi:hypothetical protein